MFVRRFGTFNIKKREITSMSGTFSFLLLAFLFTGIFITGCDINNSPDTAVVIETDFRESADEWEPFFTGYNVGWDEKMELTSGYRNLPEPLNTNESGYFISAINNSDDVKMLFRRQVADLEPNTTFRVRYTLRFATDEPAGCAGVGGAPGESVKVIADAGQLKPEPFIEDDYYKLNVQYRQHNNPGAWYQDAILGDIANSQECGEEEQYEIKELRSGQRHSAVTADENGNAWLLFGTRSGFEGETELYYTYFSAEFSTI